MMTMALQRYIYASYILVFRAVERLSRVIVILVRKCLLNATTFWPQPPVVKFHQFMGKYLSKTFSTSCAFCARNEVPGWGEVWNFLLMSEWHNLIGKFWDAKFKAVKYIWNAWWQTVDVTKRSKQQIVIVFSQPHKRTVCDNTDCSLFH